MPDDRMSDGDAVAADGKSRNSRIAMQFCMLVGNIGPDTRKPIAGSIVRRRFHVERSVETVYYGRHRARRFAAASGQIVAPSMCIAFRR